MCCAIRAKAYEWMVVSCLPDRVSVRFVVALVAVLFACNHWDSALAFDFFGLWGSDEGQPPVSPAAISYAVTVDVAGGDKGLKSAVQDASSLYKLRNDAPPDGDALARRAQSDFGPIIDTMWGAGYYDATVTISIDRASLSILSSDIAGFAHAAENYRNRAAAPVQCDGGRRRILRQEADRLRHSRRRQPVEPPRLGRPRRRLPRRHLPRRGRRCLVRRRPQQTLRARARR